MLGTVRRIGLDRLLPRRAPHSLPRSGAGADRRPADRAGVQAGHRARCSTPPTASLRWARCSASARSTRTSSTARSTGWRAQQPQIEAALARRHLERRHAGALRRHLELSGGPLLRARPARLQPRRQARTSCRSSIGLLCAADGCPVAIEVFEGNTGDPTTLAAQIDKLKQRFALDHVVLVGDRGMITQARIERTQAGRARLDHRAARAGDPGAASRAAPLQLSLFDERDLAEITSPDYPGERLIVCRNPALAAERARKREELLAATERELARIAAAVQRARAAAARRGRDRPRGRRRARPAQDGQALHARHHRRRASALPARPTRIAAEAALDGIYVIRTSLPAERSR